MAVYLIDGVRTTVRWDTEEAYDDCDACGRGPLVHTDDMRLDCRRCGKVYPRIED